MLDGGGETKQVSLFCPFVSSKENKVFQKLAQKYKSCYSFTLAKFATNGVNKK